MANPNISTQINSVAFKATVIALALFIVSLFFPLGSPGATQEEAAEWLINDLTLYMVGWMVQFVLMFCTTTIFVGAAWQIYSTNPLRSILLWSLTGVSFIAFSITKFIAVWAVPLSARSLAAGSETRDSAEAFLLATNPSVSFGLAPTLDFLGFLIYGVMGIILFRPLVRLSTSAKVAAVSLFIYGIIICLILAVAVTAIISQGDIWTYAESSSLLFLVAVVALLIRFKSQINPAND
ncbi:MAG: hypothetical protein VCB26_03425 [Candidatus Hydrogenedentota bacterium]